MFYYIGEPMYQDGLVAQAIDRVVSQNGIAYFAAAGNFGEQSYESSAFSTAPDTVNGVSGAFYNFDLTVGTDTRQQVFIQKNTQVNIELQWDDPFYTSNGVDTDLDFYLVDESTQHIVAYSESPNTASVGEGGQVPAENLSWINNTGDTSFDLMIRLNTPNQPPGQIRWVNERADDGHFYAMEFQSPGSTINPHAAAALALAIGAYDIGNLDSPTSYSSFGPPTILFDAEGNRFSAPDKREGPQLAAVTNVATSVPGFLSFDGTSAAAPHVAAIAALVLQENPQFSPQQLYDRLESTADPRTGSENQVGHGLVNAFRAVFGHDGKTGDVIAIDLKTERGGSTFEAVGFENIAGVKVLTSADLGGAAFATTGQLYVLPDPGFAGSITLQVKVDGQQQNVDVVVSPGDSTTGPNAVTFGGHAVNVLRVQQRLRFLNYPGADGKPLEVNGHVDAAGLPDANTRWAIGLFNAAMTGSTLDASATVIRRDFINSPDVPRWTELSPDGSDGPEGPLGYNQQKDGFYILPNVADGSPQSDRWATDPAVALIQSAAILSLALPPNGDDGLPDPNGLIAQQDRLELRKASPQQGGPTSGNEQGGDNQAGLQLDIETPSSNEAERDPFFAFMDLNGVRYVRGRDPQTGLEGIIHYRDSPIPADRYYIATSVGANAVRAESPQQPNDPIRAWDNREVLYAIRRFLLDNTATYYDVNRIRKQFLALLDARVADDGPSLVASIYYNDPRTWFSGFDAAGNPTWEGDGLSGPIRFVTGVNGVFQVNLVPPVQPTPLGIGNPGALIQGTGVFDSQKDEDRAAVLVNGLTAFADWLEQGLPTINELSRPLPLVGRSLLDSLPLSDIIQSGLTIPLQQFLNALPAAEFTTTAVEAFLAGLQITLADPTLGDVTVSVAPGSVTGGLYQNADGREVRFNLTLQATRHSEKVSIDLGANADAMGLRLPSAVPVGVVSTFSMDFSFGFQLDSASTFFVRTGNITFETSVAEATLSFPMDVGFIGTEVFGGRIDLDAAVVLDLNPSDHNVRGTITREEFEGTSIESLASPRIIADRLDVSLPVQAKLGDFATTPSESVALLHASDLFSGAAPGVSFQGFDELIQFTRVSPTEVLGMLQKVRDWLGTLETRLSGELTVPFVQDLTTKQLFDLATAFQDGALRPVTVSIEEASSDPTLTFGDPRFATAQELAAQLDMTLLDYNYDSASDELTYTFSFHPTIRSLIRTLDLDPAEFDLLFPESPFLDLTTTSVINATIGAHFDFTFAIDLAKAAGPPANDDFFLVDTHVGGFVDLDAPDIAFQGRLGCIEVTGGDPDPTAPPVLTDGHGVAHLDVMLDGLDQKLYTADGLPEEAKTPRVVSGTATFLLDTLRPTENLFTVPSGENPRATLSWSDLGDWGTRAMSFEDADDFLCYQYVCYDKLVEALKLASDYLNQAASHATFKTDLPVIDKSLSDFVVFAAKFQGFVDKLDPDPSIDKTAQDWKAEAQSALAKTVGLPESQVHVDLAFAQHSVIATIDVDQIPVATAKDSIAIPWSAAGGGAGERRRDGGCDDRDHGRPPSRRRARHVRLRRPEAISRRRFDGSRRN